MIEKEEKAPKYKPFAQGSKFLKPNPQGQVSKNCIFFNFGNPNCRFVPNLDTITHFEQMQIIERDCKVLNNCFCSDFRG